MANNNKIAVCIILLIAIALFCSCLNTATGTIIEMELTEQYDFSDPFVHEKLFYVNHDVNTLDLDASFQMQGESGILEIADNETGQVFWSDAWDGNVEETAFTVSLSALDEETEYVIRFTVTKIIYAKIIFTSESSLDKEREKPLKTKTV